MAKILNVFQQEWKALNTIVQTYSGCCSSFCFLFLFIVILYSLHTHKHTHRYLLSISGLKRKSIIFLIQWQQQILFIISIIHILTAKYKMCTIYEYWDTIHAKYGHFADKHIFWKQQQLQHVVDEHILTLEWMSKFPAIKIKV